MAPTWMPSAAVTPATTPCARPPCRCRCAPALAVNNTLAASGYRGRLTPFSPLQDPLLRSDGRFVATGDDYGKVRLYNYPCVVEDAPSRCYNAHSSHVKNVKFAYDNRCVFLTHPPPTSNPLTLPTQTLYPKPLGG